jgi:hypothetical protein
MFAKRTYRDVCVWTCPSGAERDKGNAMDEFDAIVANSITSLEEVVMVSDAQIGAEHDIDREASQVVAYVDVYLQSQEWARNQRNRPNPFKMH